MTTKHNWTEQELWVVCVCYKEGISVDLALRLTNTTNRKSMEMRYANCLFLDKGKVEGALSHASKLHQKVWNEIQELYKNQQKTKDVYSLCETIITVITVFYITIFLLSSQKWN